jgi:hypothetical protein
MSEQVSAEQGPGDRDALARDVAEAGATDEPMGNLSVEDDPEGTTDPADLAGSGGPQDEGVDR